MNEIELIVKLHEALEEQGVPESEPVALSTDYPLGECQSMVGVIVQAEAHQNEWVGLYRQHDNKFLCRARQLPDGTYEFGRV